MNYIYTEDVGLINLSLSVADNLKVYFMMLPNDILPDGTIIRALTQVDRRCYHRSFSINDIIKNSLWVLFAELKEDEDLESIYLYSTVTEVIMDNVWVKHRYAKVFKSEDYAVI